MHHEQSPLLHLLDLCCVDTKCVLEYSAYRIAICSSMLVPVHGAVVVVVVAVVVVVVVVVGSSSSSSKK